ncbi:hypothetical protein Ae201684P_009165 [Aphanomyces euteiches]|nr:hypothetical protein Ae201684P_009165 [Aphanomyces euteiches]
MKVNADLSKAALAHHEQITYVPSPSNGVFRGMLDRDGDEVALATTLVRYAPNSKFPAHKHDAGEEFLVLEGTFNDNVGTYPTGTYVHWINPRTLNWKRWLSHPFVDTTKTSCGAVRSLYHNETTGEHVWFLHLRAGARVESLDGFEGGEEIFVVDGSASALYDGTSTQLLKYSWLRLPPGRTAKTVLHNTAHEDVRIFVMTGHLRRFLSASS